MIPEQELLELLSKTEQEQFNYFNAFDCIADDKWDCLDSLTGRLWKRAVEEAFSHLQDICDSERMFPFLRGKLSYYTAWLFDSKPIDRIVAAIIALQRAGVDVKESGE